MLAAEKPAQKIAGAIRWEGNNILAFRDFLADFQAILEPDGSNLDIRFFEGEVMVLQILLRHGDGLLMDEDGMIATARDMVWDKEKI